MSLMHSRGPIPTTNFRDIVDRVFRVLKKQLPVVQTSFVCSKSKDEPQWQKPTDNLTDELLISNEGELGGARGNDEFFGRALSMTCEVLRTEPESCPDVLAVHVRSVALAAARYGSQLTCSQFVKALETMDSQVGCINLSRLIDCP